MGLDRSTTRVAVALAALLLVAGTALAADPSTSPSASPSAEASTAASLSPSPSPSPQASPNAPASPKPSSSPEASEAPEVSEAPEAAENDTSAPSADQLARVVDRLKAAGIATTPAELASLSAKVGLGGAVRVLVFAHASGKTAAQILALFQGGEGWGRIAKDLDLSIGPGIGWVMGGGQGKGHGPKPSHGPKP